TEPFTALLAAQPAAGPLTAAAPTSDLASTAPTLSVGLGAVSPMERTQPDTWWSRVQRLFQRDADAAEAVLATEEQVNGVAPGETVPSVPYIDWDQVAANAKGKTLQQKPAPSLLPKWFQDVTLTLELEDTTQGRPGTAGSPPRAAV